MTKASVPKALLVQLRKNGCSDEVIRALWKWYDSSEKKGVASY